MFFDSISHELAGVLPTQGVGVSLQSEVAQLFLEAREDVYRYLLTLGLYPPEAQETTQEVFLRLYVTRKRNVEIENPRAWIFRVAHNLGLKVRSRHGSPACFDSQLEARLADPQINPERTLIECERWVRFHRAMESLSEQQQRCVRLRLEGLRYPEIAATLGISASAVGEFLRRAMTRLKKVVHD